MKISLKQERYILFAVWAVAVVAGVLGGPILSTVTGQPIWIFLGLLVLAVLLGRWLDLATGRGIAVGRGSDLR